MNQRNSAWHGAVKVAGVRLKTIDEAIARLEAVVPGSDGNAGGRGYTQPDSGGWPDTVHPNADNYTNSGYYSQAYTPRPTPVPDSSRRAVEAFVGRGV